MPEPPIPEQPLSASELAELDGYGCISGRMLLPRGAVDLWEREILYGSAATEGDRGILG